MTARRAALVAGGVVAALVLAVGWLVVVPRDIASQTQLGAHLPRIPGLLQPGDQPRPRFPLVPRCRWRLRCRPGPLVAPFGPSVPGAARPRRLPRCVVRLWGGSAGAHHSPGNLRRLELGPTRVPGPGPGDLGLRRSGPGRGRSHPRGEGPGRQRGGVRAGGIASSPGLGAFSTPPSHGTGRGGSGRRRRGRPALHRRSSELRGVGADLVPAGHGCPRSSRQAAQRRSSSRDRGSSARRFSISA